MKYLSMLTLILTAFVFSAIGQVDPAFNESCGDPESRRAKQLFRLAPPSVKAAIAVAHLHAVKAKAADLELNAEQVRFIDDLIPQITPMYYSDGPDHTEFPASITERAKTLFGNDRRVVLTTIGTEGRWYLEEWAKLETAPKAVFTPTAFYSPITDAKPADLPVQIKAAQSGAFTDCDCNFGWGCSSYGGCWVCASYYPSQCTIKGWGCGFLWALECNGLCQIGQGGKGREC